MLDSNDLQSGTPPIAAARRKDLMRTSWHWPAACIVALCCASCTAHEARWGGGAASSSGSGASVKELWRAHGNPGAWRKHSAVSFAYSVEILKDAE